MAEMRSPSFHVELSLSPPSYSGVVMHTVGECKLRRLSGLDVTSYLARMSCIASLHRQAQRENQRADTVAPVQCLISLVACSRHVDTDYPRRDSTPHLNVSFRAAPSASSMCGTSLLIAPWLSKRAHLRTPATKPYTCAYTMITALNARSQQPVKNLGANRWTAWVWSVVWLQVRLQGGVLFVENLEAEARGLRPLYLTSHRKPSGCRASRPTKVAMGRF
jgi:hypothetical protein